MAGISVSIVLLHYATYTKKTSFWQCSHIISSKTTVVTKTTVITTLAVYTHQVKDTFVWLPLWYYYTLTKHLASYIVAIVTL